MTLADIMVHAERLLERTDRAEEHFFQVFFHPLESMASVIKSNSFKRLGRMPTLSTSFPISFSVLFIYEQGMNLLL